MNVMEPIWTKIFIKQTYSCIKDRGIHNVAYDLRWMLESFTHLLIMTYYVKSLKRRLKTKVF
jgi:hypothetical protein